MQTLATEMFKVSNNLSPEIIKEIFQERIVPSNNSFTSCQVNSLYHATESLSFLGPKIWELVPLEIKESENINVFKSRVKSGRLHIAHEDYVAIFSI